MHNVMKENGNMEDALCMGDVCLAPPKVWRTGLLVVEPQKIEGIKVLSHG